MRRSDEAREPEQHVPVEPAAALAMVAESRVGADVKGTLRTDAIASAWLGRASGLAWLSLMQSCRSQTNERASEYYLTRSSTCFNTIQKHWQSLCSSPWYVSECESVCRALSFTRPACLSHSHRGSNRIEPNRTEPNRIELDDRRQAIQNQVSVTTST